MIALDGRENKPPRPELGAALPRGRHRLPPEIVERHQRDRVAAAVWTILADRGYDALTVGILHRTAGISRSTFYVHFANKQEAVLAAFDSVFEGFRHSLVLACASEGEWPKKVRAAVKAAVRFAGEHPDEAQLLSGFSLCSDPTLARRVFGSHDELAELLGDSCTRSSDHRLPALVAPALVGAITNILARRLIEGQSAALEDMQATLVQLALSPYLGLEEATAVATGAA